MCKTHESTWRTSLDSGDATAALNSRGLSMTPNPINEKILGKSDFYTTFVALKTKFGSNLHFMFSCVCVGEREREYCEA